MSDSHRGPVLLGSRNVISRSGRASVPVGNANFGGDTG